MRFPYHVRVAGEVNRDEWAKVLREQMTVHTKGKKAPFARLLSIDVSTLDNWLEGKVRVSDERVNQFAEAFKIPVIGLKMRLGIYGETDFPDDLRGKLSAEAVDEEQRKVLDLNVDDETKMLILQQLEEWRAADDRILEEQRDRDRKRRQRELDYLIEQARRSG